MRFISDISEFGIQIIPMRVMVLATGQEQVLQEPLYIKFTRGDVTAYEVEQAKEKLSFRGFQTMRDEVTMVSPITRLSSFDTELEAVANNWDAETKALVEKTLMEKVGPSLIYVSPTPVEQPWPNYEQFSNEHDFETLLAKLTEDGYHLIDVLRYERHPDGPQRESMIAALEDALVAEEAAEADKEFIPAV